MIKQQQFSVSILGRALFSPRVDYNNKWLPVGRGDPLKNDPTYDYSPPVLDRVRYWGDAAANQKNKNEVLLLGVSSKRPYPQQQKKESKQSSVPVRRNYYPQQVILVSHRISLLLLFLLCFSCQLY